MTEKQNYSCFVCLNVADGYIPGCDRYQKDMSQMYQGETPCMWSKVATTDLKKYQVYCKANPGTQPSSQTMHEAGVTLNAMLITYLEE